MSTIDFTVDGLRMNHKCEQCGVCCTKEVFQVIYVTGAEINRIVEKQGDVFKYFKGVGLGKVTKNSKVQTIFQLKFVDGRCPFQKNNKCSIHNIRPHSCRVYPRQTPWHYCVRETNGKMPKDIMFQDMKKLPIDKILLARL